MFLRDVCLASRPHDAFKKIFRTRQKYRLDSLCCYDCRPRVSVKPHKVKKRGLKVRKRVGSDFWTSDSTLI